MEWDWIKQLRVLQVQDEAKEKRKALEHGRADFLRNGWSL
jgi:hypothetical protein